MRLKVILYLSIFCILISCVSPSDKEHSCKCDYPNKTDDLIQDVKYFNDYDQGKECDLDCSFKRLLLFFYDGSESSKHMIKLIESDLGLTNNINENFAFVCLLTENNSSNLKLQQQLANGKEQSLFVILNSTTDTVIDRFGYLNDAAEMNRKLISSLTKNE